MATYLGQNKVNLRGGITTSVTGTDTSDATATANNIEKGYTAYVNGEKVTGSMPQTSTALYGTETISYKEYASGNEIQMSSYKFSEKCLFPAGAIFSLYTKAENFGNATASDVASGKTFTSSDGLLITGTAEPYNCEAYIITSTSNTVNFKTSTGTIKAWGYGSSSSGYTTTLYAFCGDKYYRSATYGSSTSTKLSLSISNGVISGLPSMTSCNLLITRGV